MREVLVRNTGMQPRDKWIPWYFVAFFLVICSVDGVMAYFAITTRTGVVTEQYYERGLHYNDTVKQAEKQAALGWAGDIQFVASADSKMKGNLQFALNDRNANAIAGAKVTARIVRPTQDGHDEFLVLNELSAGQYASPLAFPMEGQWDIEVAVTSGENKFQLNKRLVIR